MPTLHSGYHPESGVDTNVCFLQKRPRERVLSLAVLVSSCLSSPPNPLARYVCILAVEFACARANVFRIGDSNTKRNHSHRIMTRFRSHHLIRIHSLLLLRFRRICCCWAMIVQAPSSGGPFHHPSRVFCMPKSGLWG